MEKVSAVQTKVSLSLEVDFPVGENVCVEQTKGARSGEKVSASADG